ncbi:MAG: type II toxin-antitoxin system MqsA family antitoxin [Campylobacterales bacterium]|nr:type II toxin-antitoxin system MqsA family antitoxin [Campylobacterales bacterium]
MKQCPLCQGAIAQGHTTFSADLGFDVVVVRHVPAQVCAQCGEEWLDDATSTVLEQTIERARENRPVVEVIEWQTKVVKVA